MVDGSAGRARRSTGPPLNSPSFEGGPQHMHITWIVDSHIEQVGDRYSSPTASVRYRVLTPAEALVDYGHQIKIVRNDPKLPPERFDPLLRTDAVVISKVLSPWNLELAWRAKSLGARVLFDLCDDHFDTPQLAETYFRLCEAADAIVASTPEMAAVIRQHTGREASIVEDPYEAPAGEPTFAPQADCLRLLWFGHPTNFDTLADLLPKLETLARQLPMHLHVVSNPAGTNIEQYLDDLNRRGDRGLQGSFSRWSPEVTWQAMRECDLVVVPSRSDHRKRVKSPNRVIEPLRTGRFVTAYPVPSYRQFADFAWLGEDVTQGIRWAVDHADEVRDRIRRGQGYIASHFSPAAVARKWDAVVTQTVEQ